MIYIYICEDDDAQLNIVKKYVEEAIKLENFSMEIRITTKNPYNLLKSISESDTNSCGIYFLDVNLNADIDGVDLAEKIRILDPASRIVFVTGTDEYTPMYYRSKFNADCIQKNETTKIRGRVYEILVNINIQHQNKIPDSEKNITIKINYKDINVTFSDIVFITTSARTHKIIIQTVDDGKYETGGQIKGIMDSLDYRFYRCHDSYIINKDYIKENGVDFANKIVYLTTGMSCPISYRRRSGLKRYKR